MASPVGRTVSHSRQPNHGSQPHLEKIASLTTRGMSDGLKLFGLSSSSGGLGASNAESGRGGVNDPTYEDLFHGGTQTDLSSNGSRSASSHNATTADGAKSDNKGAAASNTGETGSQKSSGDDGLIQVPTQKIDANIRDLIKQFNEDSARYSEDHPDRGAMPEVWKEPETGGENLLILPKKAGRAAMALISPGGDPRTTVLNFIEGYGGGGTEMLNKIKAQIKKANGRLFVADTAGESIHKWYL